MMKPKAIEFSGVEGNRLAADLWGGHGKPVIFLHGGGQTRRAWDDSARKAASVGMRAITLDQLDRVIRTVEDAEALGMTVLGVIPHIDESARLRATQNRKKRREGPEQLGNRDLIVHAYPKSSVAECCRTIRTNITFMSAERPRKTLVVTSASPREGKTTVSISLAISLAQSGKRILIVDDELPVARALARLLVQDHEVDLAITGEQALERMFQADYDLILCDLMMPTMSGMEVYDTLRRSVPG